MVMPFPLDPPPLWWNLADAPVDESGPRVLSTFSSGGGSSMGYRLAGCKVVGAVDIDPKPMACYRSNLVDTLEDPSSCRTEVMGVADILNSPDLIERWQNLDILDGSPPCTTFSTAGVREQNWGKEKKFREGQSSQVLDRLFFDYLDVVNALRPRTFVAENVMGILYGNAKRYVSEIIGHADRAGYDLQIITANAAHFGVAQSRSRVFFIGRRRDLRLSKVTAPIPVVPPPYRSFREAVSGLPEEKHPKLSSLQKTIWENTPEGGGVKRYYQRNRGRSGSGFSTYKIHWDTPCRTIAQASEHFHPSEKRNLSSAEIRRLSSFPEDYVIPDPISPRYMKYLCGMSVPPYLAAAVARSVIATL